MRLIIAGGRDFEDTKLFYRAMNKYLGPAVDRGEPIEVVNGMCKTGGDKLGRVWATDNGFKILPFPADWDKYGKSAGPRRNAVMAKVGTHCIVFWDGRSRGTKNMIVEAEKKGLPLRIVRY